jgi:hypothetical protein
MSRNAYCTRECSEAFMLVHWAKKSVENNPVTRNCHECGKEFLATKRWQRNLAKNAYCTTKCQKAYCGAISSKTMTETNGRFASAIADRMKARNPMQIDSVREKVSARLKSMGHKPPIQGGNGRGLTQPQQLLLSQLKMMSNSWESEYVVRTGARRGDGYPTHYKIDLACPARMLAIEVDGHSHSALKTKERDAKKQDFLTGLGWTVLRFTNASVLESMEAAKFTISKY